jgi:hypothetical protein
VLAIWIADAPRDGGRRFVVHADEKLSAFIELERQVLTVTFYLESIRGVTNDIGRNQAAPSRLESFRSSRHRACVPGERSPIDYAQNRA